MRHMTTDPLMLLILVFVGLLAGMFGGLIGTGGCSIMLPILDFYIYGGKDTALAIGTTIFAVIFTTLSGAYGHLKIRNLDVKSTKWLASGGAMGAVVGSIMFWYLKGQLIWLWLILGLVFILPSIRMIYEGALKKGPAKPSGESWLGGEIPGNPYNKTVFGFIIGLTTGLVGLGGGYALVPGLIYLFGAPVHVTMGTSLATMIPLAIISASFKAYSGDIDFGAGIALAIGTIIGAQIGARLIKRFSPWALKLIFGAYFLYVSIKYLGKAIGIPIP
ncbi:MAG: sulfite exporter TauE/SafE family protein [Candidatus Baldrarchaeia archaeon]